MHVGPRGRKGIVVEAGANGRLSVEDVRGASHAIRRASVVVAQLEVPMPCVEEAFRIGRAAGAQTLLDPAPGRPVPDRLLALVDLVRPNAREAEVLTGIAVRGKRSALRAARSLLRRGVGAVAVEAGRDGNLVLSRDEEIWLPLLPVRSVDATGAGDAFCGACAVALAEGRSLGDAARLANAAAAIATTRFGAQAGLPTRAELLRLVEQSPPPQELSIDGLPPADGGP